MFSKCYWYSLYPMETYVQKYILFRWNLWRKWLVFRHFSFPGIPGKSRDLGVHSRFPGMLKIREKWRLYLEGAYWKCFDRVAACIQTSIASAQTDRRTEKCVTNKRSPSNRSDTCQVKMKILHFEIILKKGDNTLDEFNLYSRIVCLIIYILFVCWSSQRKFKLNLGITLHW